MSDSIALRVARNTEKRRAQQLLDAAKARAAALLSQDDLDGYAIRYRAAVEDREALEAQEVERRMVPRPGVFLRLLGGGL